uniref:Fish-egg lectin-like n=1 Tax=Cyprinodon variegatus TaxID=28743 RepID=A0A3Q2CKH2_CYPVA
MSQWDLQESGESAMMTKSIHFLVVISFLFQVSIFPNNSFQVYNCFNFCRLIMQIFMCSGQKLKQLDAGGEGHVVGVTDSDSIHCLDASNVSPTQQQGSLSWITVPGLLIHFSCGPNTCWGVNSNQDIYFIKISPNSCKTSEWTKVDGAAVKAEVGTDGRVFVVNKAGNLFERIGISDKTPGGANWKLIEFQKPIKYVSYDQGRLWIVTECEIILECTQ